jgi:protein N-terminal glutamine amidohydrolase
VLDVRQYHPFYCEENAYHLCRDPALADREPAALFIRGSDGACLMWHQRVADALDDPVQWDYHVVVLTRGPWQIWDPDSALGCPVPAAGYLRASFRPGLAVPPGLRPRFRLVSAAELARSFASDRSHMRGPDGEFTRPPPPWPPIGPAGASTLARYLAHGDPIAGEELDLRALLRRVTDP